MFFKRAFLFLSSLSLSCGISYTHSYNSSDIQVHFNNKTFDMSPTESVFYEYNSSTQLFGNDYSYFSMNKDRIDLFYIEEDNIHIVNCMDSVCDYNKYDDVLCGVNTKYLRRLQKVEWSDCFEDFGNTYYIKNAGVAITRRMYESLDKDIDKVKDYVQSAVAFSNLIYRHQMHISTKIDYLYIGTGQESWSNKDCNENTMTTLSKFVGWAPPKQEAYWMLFEICDRYAGGSSGTAYVGTACTNGVRNKGVTKGVGTRIRPHMTFTHELGHLLNARHSFENGQGTTGGIMDYGNPYYKGEIQFNDLRKREFCSHIKRMIAQCSSNLLIKETSPTRIPTMKPTMKPTRIPTMEPTRIPTRIPTMKPTTPSSDDVGLSRRSKIIIITVCSVLTIIFICIFCYIVTKV